MDFFSTSLELKFIRVAKSKSIEVFKAVLNKFNGNGCYSTTLPQKSDELRHSLLINFLIYYFWNLWY
ncbi:hypothetical protein BpHYR1_054591 [Brachionus plicatilis]|uniref:Uncharacterized protein n=1 Tax=Brachionus plicatilis TaxID=10195 RepID=A0A3M7QWQ0_BRAPC|nr:hypothetical protein BpHYR1_054591 [Brachionus plicatilis]